VTISDSQPTQVAWVQNGGRHLAQDQDEQTLYEVAESGANYRGTFYYKRLANLSIGPVLLGEVTRLGHPTLGAAKAAAEQDYRQIQRLGEWFSYMFSNAPPGSG
jgi:hypothetical protein